LWPDVPDERARANLRRALWQLPDGWVVVDGPDLVLDATVDIAEAREMANRAIRGVALSWAEVELLSRDLLTGWFEEWVVVEQECFHLLRVQALEAACRNATEAGDFALATRAGFMAFQSEPLRESAVAALVEAHLGEGNRGLALRHFSTYAQLLAEELHVPPGEDLERLVSPLIHTE
jgi:DNA-binding SARP family transcriptional activator